MKRRTFLQALGVLGSGHLLAGRSPGAGNPGVSPLQRFKLGSISDEWSQDFEEALQAMKAYGLRWVEIRTVWNTYNTEATPEQIRRMKELLGQYEFRVSVLDTALFKCALPGTKPAGMEKDVYPYREQFELLKRAIERAHVLETDKLRVFAFWRVASPRRHFRRIAEELSKAAEFARASQARLVLENEGSCNVATGRELARMLELVPLPNVGANWDIGNGYWRREVSFPAGYAALPKHRIWHMHVKDVRCESQARKREKTEAWKPKASRETERSKCRTAIVGTGQVDLVGQLAALLRDGYEGTMSLEPEYEDAQTSHLEATRRSVQGLLKAMEAAMA